MADVTNPCRGICKQHPELKVCQGCYRSRLEIRMWDMFTPLEKLNVLQEVTHREDLYGDIKC
jgi:predicted Fe-S protein YdhL (DUF1289 family)